MSEWSHLPNAKHIDRILASVKENPAAWDAAWNAAWNAAWEAAWDAAWNAARDAARDAAWNAGWNAARDAAWNAGWNAGWNAALALVAYDHAAKYLEMTPAQLRVWAELSEDPAAVLLIPAVIAFESLGAMYPIDVAS